MGRTVVALRRLPIALSGEIADVPVTTDPIQARDDGPAIALICSPTAQHAADARSMLALGCHVLVEKPVADAPEKAVGVRSAAVAARLACGVASCLRFHPVVQAARRLIQLGAIGRPYHVTIWCGQHLSEWRPGTDLRETYSAVRAAGGGVVLDLIHEIDYVHWLFGPARRVIAMTSRSASLREVDATAVADAVMELASGVRTLCHLDYLSRPKRRWGVAHGEEGALRWDLFAPSLEAASPDGSWRQLPLRADWQWNDMYIDEVRAFETDVTEGRQSAELAIDDGIRALESAAAIERSARLGTAVTLAS